LFGSWVAFELAAEQTQLENDHWSNEVKKFMSIWTFREPSHEEIRKAKARTQLSVREPSVDRMMYLTLPRTAIPQAS